MRRLAFIVLALLASAAPAAGHPHILISSVTRFIEKDGQFTHVEIEWRFDPMASSMEIIAADADRDGKLSPREIKELGDIALPELKSFGYLAWFSTGAKDFRPPKAPTFNARIADPAEFVPEDWAPTPDPPGGPMAKPGPPPKPDTKVETKGRRFRNLVYIFRYPLAAPTKTLSVAALDPEDFIRIEADRKSPHEIVGKAEGAKCSLDKHPTLKSEFWPGNPVFADRVTCTLP
ncbi:MAG: DUF1007 family protein [Alphaproteobacteria bacterium]|nr:DUF1007 family protein [Alphaproteobacteria bacterium]MCW5739780.1 DUF1007 family protein [Alphaproteobacteria bacterium]